MSADPYAPLPPPFWEKYPRAVPAVVVGFLTALATALMFPTFVHGTSAPELGFAFAAPAILWAYRRPSFKLYAWTMFAAQAAGWLVVLCWLRHVTYVGWLLLGPFVGAWVGVWYLAVWWAMPRIAGQATLTRLVCQLGLAGAWVVVEWTRTWFLTGFPWMPLAASQWKLTSLLQIASYTGAGGVSFVLIVVNLGFAAYAHRLFFEDRSGMNRRSQEFMLGLFACLVCLCVFMVETKNSALYGKPLARVAFIQPDIPQSVKWEPGEAESIVRTLQRLTHESGEYNPSLMLWPESAFPYSFDGDPRVPAAVTAMVKDAGAPLIFGAVAVDPAASPGATPPWHDAAMAATPEGGVMPAYYSKRHLVPFGEYIPWRFLFGWLSKVVPLEGDAVPGKDASPLLLNLRDGAVQFGPLICYEDVFPDLARESVGQGADALVVLTNDAWYGEEAAAYQHAAHSVLRAVETRRPVLRCGNAGWSGWIDEYGSVGVDDPEAGHYPHIVMKNGSIYTRGVRIINVTHDSRWVGKESFYVRHGEWFLVLSAALAIFGYVLIRGYPPRVLTRGPRFDYTLPPASPLTGF